MKEAWCCRFPSMWSNDFSRRIRTINFLFSQKFPALCLNKKKNVFFNRLTTYTLILLWKQCKFSFAGHFYRRTVHFLLNFIALKHKIKSSHEKSRALVGLYLSTNEVLNNCRKESTCGHVGCCTSTCFWNATSRNHSNEVSYWQRKLLYWHFPWLSFRVSKSQSYNSEPFIVIQSWLYITSSLDTPRWKRKYRQCKFQ